MGQLFSRVFEGHSGRPQTYFIQRNRPLREARVERSPASRRRPSPHPRRNRNRSNVDTTRKQSFRQTRKSPLKREQAEEYVAPRSLKHRSNDQMPLLCRLESWQTATTEPERERRLRSRNLKRSETSVHKKSSETSRVRYQPTSKDSLKELQTEKEKDKKGQKIIKPQRTCVVCTDSRTLRHFPHRPATKQCEHEANTCNRCLRRWITTQFQTKIWNQIHCPECSLPLEYTDIHEFATSEIFKQYASVRDLQCREIYVLTSL